MGQCCCCCVNAPPRVLPGGPSAGRSEADEFARLLAEELTGPNSAWKIPKDWPKKYTKQGFMMRVALRAHESGNANKLLRADGKFRGCRPQMFLDYLLNPENLPGLQEWRDVEATADGGFVKYCRVKAPLMRARDHCWRYTVDRRDDGSIFVCIRTAEHAACPEVPGVIRAFYYNACEFRMSAEEPNVCLMTEFIFQDLKGGLPPGLLNAALPGGTLQANAIEMAHFKKKGLLLTE